jgi:sortase A
MSSKQETNSQNNSLMKKSEAEKTFIFIGLILIFIAIVILGYTFKPVIKEEFKYFTRSKKSEKIKPINKNFSIVIPKIKANSKVVADVSPYNEKNYQLALTKGVAHAQNTAYPGEIGNTFIFAHSSEDWYKANQYNSVFYLLNKLEKKDDIYIYYKNREYHYQVFDKKIVNPKEINYMIDKFAERKLTLMTCWPPGTTLKRLIVIANLLKK